MEISPEQLWRDLFAVADGMKSVHADSKSLSLFYQVTVSQLKMIRGVYELTGSTDSGVALKVLARKLGTTAAAASEMVDVLVRKKILERKQDPADRRQVQIRLIPELHSHFVHIEEHITRLTGEFLQTLPPEQQQIFSHCTAEFVKFVTARTAGEEK